LLEDHVNQLLPKTLLEALLCEVLIVDEAGMCNEDTFDFLDSFPKYVKKKPNKPFGGVRIILIGDVMQLEPMRENNDNQNTKKKDK
jgi:hypothetical protein